VIETNLEPKDELRAAAQRLLDAAMDYFYEYRKATGGAAVVWVKDSDGRLVILTRGEYTATLMQNIDKLRGQDEKLFDFDGEAKEPK
jgi:hypothetical protein